MLRRLIIFLIRKKLGLRKYEMFQFVNQKSQTDTYWFNKNMLVKATTNGMRPSGVSLNWLMCDKCEIRSLDNLSNKHA